MVSVLKGKYISDTEGRNNEGLDVDLNFVSPIAEETKNLEKADQEGRVRNVNMEGNRNFDEEGSSWDMLQMMENESQINYNNGSPIEVEESQIVKETPL
ncbi:MAG: hypothetical protein Q8761_03330 [Sweet potato little leaf phytoplasma]|nr:hypothetical protein [Sweet potato little leaf phytoplasma]